MKQATKVCTPRDFLSEYAKCFKWTTGSQAPPMAGLTTDHRGEISYDLVPGMRHKRRPPTSSLAAYLDQRSTSPFKECNNQDSKDDPSVKIVSAVEKEADALEHGEKYQQKQKHRHHIKRHGQRSNRDTKLPRNKLDEDRELLSLKENIDMHLESESDQHHHDQWKLKKRQLKDMLDFLEMEHTRWRRQHGHQDPEEKEEIDERVDEEFQDSTSSSRKRWSQIISLPNPPEQVDETEGKIVKAREQNVRSSQPTVKSASRKRWTDSSDELLGVNLPVEESPRVTEYQHAFTRPTPTSPPQLPAQLTEKQPVKRGRRGPPDVIHSSSVPRNRGVENGERDNRHHFSRDRQSNVAVMDHRSDRNGMEDKWEHRRLPKHRSHKERKQQRNSRERLQSKQHDYHQEPIMAPRLERARAPPDNDVLQSRSAANEKSGEGKHRDKIHHRSPLALSMSDISETSIVSFPRAESGTAAGQKTTQPPALDSNKTAKGSKPPPTSQPSQEVVSEILTRRRLARRYQRRSMDTHIWWWVDAGGRGSPDSNDDDTLQQVCSLPIGFEHRSANRSIMPANQRRPRSASPCGTYSRSDSSTYTATPRATSPGVGSQCPATGSGGDQLYSTGGETWSPPPPPPHLNLLDGGSRPGTYRLPGKDVSAASDEMTTATAGDNLEELLITLTTTGEEASGSVAGQLGGEDKDRSASDDA